jgi:hypothetical protein
MQRCNRVRADRGSTIALTMGRTCFLGSPESPSLSETQKRSEFCPPCGCDGPTVHDGCLRGAEIRGGLRTGWIPEKYPGIRATAQKDAADFRPVQYQFQPRERNTTDQATEYRLLSGELLYKEGGRVLRRTIRNRPGVVI